MQSHQGILVIDDDLDDLENFRSALTGFDPAIECITTTDAEGIWDRLEIADISPRVIVLDLYMPIMDGVVILTLIQSHANLKDIPVVILSANSEPGNAEVLEKMGASEYLVKPNSFEELKKLVKFIVAKYL